MRASRPHPLGRVPLLAVTATESSLPLDHSPAISLPESLANDIIRIVAAMLVQDKTRYPKLAEEKEFRTSTVSSPRGMVDSPHHR
jgi:hypothetical protein